MTDKGKQLLQHDDLLQVSGGSVVFPESLTSGKITVRYPSGVHSHEEINKAIESDADKIFQKYYKPGDAASVQKTMVEVLGSMKAGSLGSTGYLDPVKARVMDKFIAKFRHTD